MVIIHTKCTKVCYSISRTSEHLLPCPRIRHVVCASNLHIAIHRKFVVILKQEGFLLIGKGFAYTYDGRTTVLEGGSSDSKHGLNKNLGEK